MFVGLHMHQLVCCESKSSSKPLTKKVPGSSFSRRFRGEAVYEIPWQAQLRMANQQASTTNNTFWKAPSHAKYDRLCFLMVVVVTYCRLSIEDFFPALRVTRLVMPVSSLPSCPVESCVLPPANSSAFEPSSGSS